MEWLGLNDGHGLRYIRTGMKQFPLWSIVEPLAVRLHQVVAPMVGYRSFLMTYGNAKASDEVLTDDVLAAQLESLARALDDQPKE